MSSKQEKEPEEITPIRPYLEANVQEVLQKGLAALDKERPDNPLEFLGKYLISYAERTSGANS
jgi:protein dpy-30